MKKYNVIGVPTVLILSPEGQEIARFRYQKIAPEVFADLVLIPKSP
jgi:thiol:disulfide interchange protein